MVRTARRPPLSAADRYATRVDAVVAQRTRLRGPQPPGDLFGGVPPDHPLLIGDARRELEPNLAVLASYVQPDDVIVDVGGGGGRLSLPLALGCRELVNVDPSAAMLAAFEANARRAGVTNARAIQAGWPTANPPRGTVALVNHVTYLTREIVPFLEALEAAASRLVLLTVGDPPPPSWNRELFGLVYGEPEEIVPGHAELVDVLRELGVEPEVRVLEGPPTRLVPAPTRAAAVERAVAGFGSDQWALWPLGPELSARVREILETRFDELFVEVSGGYARRLPMGREVLITWTPRAAGG